VVEERETGNGTLRLEYVRCGKEGCHCASDQGHGPYWYAYRKQRGRVVSTYMALR